MSEGKGKDTGGTMGDWEVPVTESTFFFSVSYFENETGGNYHPNAMWCLTMERTVDGGYVT